MFICNTFLNLIINQYVKRTTNVVRLKKAQSHNFLYWENLAAVLKKVLQINFENTLTMHV